MKTDYYEKKKAFIQRNKRLFEECCKLTHLKPWRTGLGNVLVELARKEIGFAPATVSCDVYNSLMKMYKQEPPQ